MTSLLPYRSLELVSPLSAREARRALRRAVEPVRLIQFGSPRAPFVGTVKTSSFRLIKTRVGRNPFNPMILGEITEQNEVTKLSIKIRMHILSLALMLVWIGAALAVGVQSSVAAVRGQGSFEFLFPLAAMLTFGWLLMLAGYNFGANQAVRTLKRIFDAKEAKPTSL
jgi:hypothetical protein